MCWWGGWGGSLIIIDLAHRATIAYVMNRMGAAVMGDERAQSIASAAFAALSSASAHRVAAAGGTTRLIGP